MKIRDLFYKKDYIKTVEDILELKGFSLEIRNLILSVMYKLEENYEVYKQVKVEVVPFTEYQEYIIEALKKVKYLEIIENDIRNIYETIPKTRVDINKGEVYVCENELSVLHGLLLLNKRYFNEKEDCIAKEPLKKVLIQGSIQEDLEILRDFKAWSWNKMYYNGFDIYSEIIYQNINAIMGKTFMKKWQTSKTETGFTDQMLEYIETLVGKEKGAKFLASFRKILYILATDSEKKNIESKIDNTLKTVNLMQNSVEFLSYIEKEKKRINKRLKELDKILNDNKLLEKTHDVLIEKKYNKLINEIETETKSNNKNKIISIDEYNQELKVEREAILKQLKEYNYLQVPENFMSYKKKLENSISYVLGSQDIFKEIVKWQNIVYDIIYEKVLKIEDKDEILRQIYLLRYLRYIKFGEHSFVYNMATLHQKMDKILNVLVEKATKLNILNVFSDEKNTNYAIVSPALKTNIIDFSDIKLQLFKTQSVLLCIIVGNMIINEFPLLDISPKLVSVKSKKKIRLFK